MELCLYIFLLLFLTLLLANCAVFEVSISSICPYVQYSCPSCTNSINCILLVNFITYSVLKKHKILIRNHPSFNIFRVNLKNRTFARLVLFELQYLNESNKAFYSMSILEIGLFFKRLTPFRNSTLMTILNWNLQILAKAWRRMLAKYFSSQPASYSP